MKKPIVLALPLLALACMTLVNCDPITSKAVDGGAAVIDADPAAPDADPSAPDAGPPGIDAGPGVCVWGSGTWGNCKWGP